MSNVSDAWGKGKKGMSLGQASGWSFILPSYFKPFPFSFSSDRSLDQGLFIISFFTSRTSASTTDDSTGWVAALFTGSAGPKNGDV